MSTAYELTGRTRQKARTRAALVGATRELLVDGVTPTVEQAADRSGISRTTAYRYFPNQRALLSAVYPQVEETSLLPAGAPSDPVRRLELVLDRLQEQMLAYEAELRTQLRLSLEPRPHDAGELPLRQGRVVGWIEDALEPLRGRLTDPQLRRLAIAIRAAMGIEAMVWLTDVAGLDRRDAVALMRESALTLLRAAI